MWFWTEKLHLGSPVNLAIQRPQNCAYSAGGRQLRKNPIHWQELPTPLIQSHFERNPPRKQFISTSWMRFKYLGEKWARKIVFLTSHI